MDIWSVIAVAMPCHAIVIAIASVDRDLNKLDKKHCGIYILRNVKPAWIIGLDWILLEWTGLELNASASPNNLNPFHMRQLSRTN